MAADPSPAEAARRDLLAAVAPLKIDQPVRIWTALNSSREGRYRGTRDGFVRLRADDDDLVVGLAEIEALWIQNRRSRSGAKIGAYVGGAVSAAYLALLVSIANETCDTGNCDEMNFIPAVLLGTAVGAGGGALIGAVVGAAASSWQRAYPTDEAQPQGEFESAGDGTPPPKTDGPAGRRFGSLGVSLGRASSYGANTTAGAVAWRVNLWAHLTPHLRLGPEVGHYRTGAADRDLEPLYLSALPRDEDLWHAGGACQYSLGTGRLRPYAVAGLGASWWEEAFFGYSLGGGARWEPERGTPYVQIEYRYHANIQRLVETNPRFGIILAGIHLAW